LLQFVCGRSDELSRGREALKLLITYVVLNEGFSKEVVGAWPEMIGIESLGPVLALHVRIWPKAEAFDRSVFPLIGVDRKSANPPQIVEDDPKPSFSQIDKVN
jgi:hypothetical protein